MKLRFPSRSNTPQPLNAGRFPGVTVYDNVLVQKRMLETVFGVDRLANTPVNATRFYVK
mgnify:CR=1 FL=1